MRQISQDATWAALQPALEMSQIVSTFMCALKEVQHAKMLSLLKLWHTSSRRERNGLDDLIGLDEYTRDYIKVWAKFKCKPEHVSQVAIDMIFFGVKCSIHAG